MKTAYFLIMSNYAALVLFVLVVWQVRIKDMKNTTDPETIRKEINSLARSVQLGKGGEDRVKYFLQTLISRIDKMTIKESE